MDRITEAGRRAFEEAVRAKMEAAGAFGTAVAVVDAKGRTLYQQIFGVADRETGQEINEDTIFGVASVTKSFVTLSIMQLQEAGKLSLEDPVSKYIPEFHPQQKEPVRLYHLLSHSAGFYPVPRMLLTDVAADLGRTEEKDGDLSLLPDVNDEALRRVVEQLNAQKPGVGLSGAPGQYMSYCNDGFGLMAEIVRRVSGSKTFAQYLRENVLEPMGMTRSGADYLRPRLDPNASNRYEYREGRLWGKRDYYDTAFALPGAGAVTSTLRDMKRYAAMYLNHGVTLEGKRIVSSDSIRTMCRSRVSVNDQMGYGLGLSMRKLDDLTVVGHSGGLPGVSSYLAWSYGAGLGVIVLCNTSGFPSRWAAYAAMRMAWGRDPLAQDVSYLPMEWSREKKDSVCGVYGSREDGNDRWEFFLEGDSLRFRRNGVDTEFTPVQEELGVYQTKSGSAPILFHFGDDGRAFALTLGSRMAPRLED